MNFLQDFLSNLLATLAGVGLGIPIALWIGRYQDKLQEANRKKKIIQLLKIELELNLKVLEGFVRDSRDKRSLVHVLGAYSPTESWRAFSEGGEIAWIKDPELLYVISNAYFKIRTISSLSDKFETLRKNEGVSEKPAYFRLDEAVHDAINAIRNALSEISLV